MKKNKKQSKKHTTTDFLWVGFFLLMASAFIILSLLEIHDLSVGYDGVLGYIQCMFTTSAAIGFIMLTVEAANE